MSALKAAPKVVKKHPMRTISEEAVLERLRGEIAKAGSMALLAKKWDVSEAVISLTHAGVRSPSPLLLKKMHIDRATKIEYIYRVRHDAPR